ncbi:MAG: hypothetical protein ACKPKO_29155 [Candidatus Fonsibacter sp.]
MWVSSVVLHSVRKAGTYLIDDNEVNATWIVNNPRGERSLH